MGPTGRTSALVWTEGKHISRANSDLCRDVGKLPHSRVKAIEHGRVTQGISTAKIVPAAAVSWQDHGSCVLGFRRHDQENYERTHPTAWKRPSTFGKYATDNHLNHPQWFSFVWIKEGAPTRSEISNWWWTETRCPELVTQSGQNFYAASISNLPERSKNVLVWRKNILKRSESLANCGIYIYIFLFVKKKYKVDANFESFSYETKKYSGFWSSPTNLYYA